jgi:aspartate dehydrogenase
VRHGHTSAPLALGLIGYGAIGRELVRLLRRDKTPGSQLVAVLVRDLAVHPDDEVDLGVPVTASFERFAGFPFDVVVEAAGHQAMREYVPLLLRAGIDVIGVSSGALADPDVKHDLVVAAKAGGAQLRLVSGGIGGIDAVGAGSLLGLASVEYTVRKPPRALPGRYGAFVGTGEREVYAGSARDGVLQFPENVNVVATVSLAGLGFDRTRLRVVADPMLERNVHELAARGSFGDIHVHMENVPSRANPRTGVIVAGSLARAVRGLSAPIVVGG